MALHKTCHKTFHQISFHAQFSSPTIPGQFLSLSLAMHWYLGTLPSPGAVGGGSKATNTSSANVGVSNAKQSPATSTEAVTPLGASRTRFRLRKSQLIPSWNGQRNQKIVCPLRSINLFQTSYVQTKFNQIPLVILLSISKVFQTCEPHQLRQHLNHLFRISAGSYYLCKSKPFFT